MEKSYQNGRNQQIIYIVRGKIVTQWILEGRIKMEMMNYKIQMKNELFERKQSYNKSPLKNYFRKISFILQKEN